MENKKEYAVGYKKPPKVTRFKKGKSGNPKGRPKNSRNLMTLIDAELDKPVMLQENGRTLTLTKREALAKRLVNNALGGDARSTSSLIQMSHLKFESEDEIVELSEADLEHFNRLKQRLIDSKERKTKNSHNTTKAHKKLKVPL